VKQIGEENFKNTTLEEKINILYCKMFEKQKKDSREQIYLCKDYCEKFPSYKRTKEEFLAFCMKRKSSIITEKKACLCGQCPVSKMVCFRWKNYALMSAR